MAKTRSPKYRRQRRPGQRDQAFVELVGRRIYLGLYDSDESWQRYHQLLAERTVAGGPAPAPASDITVIEVAARFWTHCENYYRRRDGTATSEVDNYRQAIRPLRNLRGKSRAVDFGPKALKAVRQQMIESGWCRTINKQVDRIKRLFKWAVAEELIPANVHESLKCVSGLKANRCNVRESSPKRPVRQELIDAVKPYVSRQIWALIQLQLFTGARAGELLNLRAVDLVVSEPTWTCSPLQHKSAHRGRTRTIYFGPQAQAVIKP